MKKKGGCTIGNIGFIRCSFLELDGTEGGHIKTIADVYARCKQRGIPKPSAVIETSPGHFHVIWFYKNPLPWTAKNFRWWESQQKRFIKVFADFGPDDKACLNPVQFVRNPSQLDPKNYKRNSDVIIDATWFRTSLGDLQRGLDRAGVENERIKAEKLFLQYLRRTKNPIGTYKTIGGTIGVSERTVKRLIPKAIANGDLKIIKKNENNKVRGKTRYTEYDSLIYLEPYSTVETKTEADTDSSGVPIEGIKTNLGGNAELLRRFGEGKVGVGYRNKAMFACGLYVKCLNQGEIGFERLYQELYPGFLRCGTSEKEFRRTLKNVLKDGYLQPLSNGKLYEWGLLPSIPQTATKSDSEKWLM